MINSKLNFYYHFFLVFLSITLITNNLSATITAYPKDYNDKKIIILKTNETKIPDVEKEARTFQIGDEIVYKTTDMLGESSGKIIDISDNSITLDNDKIVKIKMVKSIKKKSQGYKKWFNYKQRTLGYSILFLMTIIGFSLLASFALTGSILYIILLGLLAVFGLTLPFVVFNGLRKFKKQKAQEIPTYKMNEGWRIKIQ